MLNFQLKLFKDKIDVEQKGSNHKIFYIFINSSI